MCSDDYDTQAAKDFTQSSDNGNISQFIKDNVLTIPCGVSAIAKQVQNYGSNNKKKLTQVYIPDTVTTIGQQAFYECTGLTEIIIPDSVVEVGNQAFRGCSNIKMAIISNKLTYIPYQMFHTSYSLISVQIGQNITGIGYGAFYKSNLQSINIPNNVTSVDKTSFESCSKLQCVSFQNKQCSIYYNYGDYNTFAGTSFNGKSNLLTEFNDICPNTKYIDCTLLTTNDKYYFFINGTKWCIEEENVVYYTINPTDNNNKYYVDICPTETPFYDPDDKPAKCSAQCGIKQYYYDNGTQAHECIQKCAGNYAKPTKGYACTNQCRFFKDPSVTYRQCTPSNETCPNNYKYQLEMSDIGGRCLYECFILNRKKYLEKIKEQYKEVQCIQDLGLRDLRIHAVQQNERIQVYYHLFLSQKNMEELLKSNWKAIFHPTNYYINFCFRDKITTRTGISTGRLIHLLRCQQHNRYCFCLQRDKKISYEKYLYPSVLNDQYNNKQLSKKQTSPYIKYTRICYYQFCCITKSADNVDMFHTLYQDQKVKMPRLKRIVTEFPIQTITRRFQESFSKVKIFNDFDYLNYIYMNTGKYRLYFYNLQNENNLKLRSVVQQRYIDGSYHNIKQEGQWFKINLASKKFIVDGVEYCINEDQDEEVINGRLIDHIEQICEKLIQLRNQWQQ